MNLRSSRIDGVAQPEMRTLIVRGDEASAGKNVLAHAHPVGLEVDRGAHGVARAIGTAHQLHLYPMMMVGVHVPQQRGIKALNKYLSTSRGIPAEISCKERSREAILIVVAADPDGDRTPRNKLPLTTLELPRVRDERQISREQTRAAKRKRQYNAKTPPSHRDFLHHSSSAGGATLLSPISETKSQSEGPQRHIPINSPGQPETTYSCNHDGLFIQPDQCPTSP